MPVFRSRCYSTGSRPNRYARGRYQPFDYAGWLRWFRNRRRIVHYNSDGEELSGDEGEDQAEKEILTVSSVDLNITRNALIHHTDEYDAVDPANEKNKPTLVIRRGQSFDVTFVFNRPYDKNNDDLRFYFEIGKQPKQTNGTEVQMRLSDKDEPASWGAKIQSQKDKTLTVTFMSPPHCFIGRWNFAVSAVKKSADSRTEKVYEHKSPIIILLNPWCKDDLVYMEDEGLKKEYVLADTGNIWRGSYRRLSPCPWKFGQFDEKMLDCALYLLEQGIPKVTVRGNPIQIARKMSAIVNAPDDDGVLVGNWSGDYEGGTSPLEWVGSVKILKEYFETKKPVMYGQCWVFSGVLTTVCRALGLPARSVTNFASAHDTDESVTIDTYFNEQNEEIEWMASDSVWNFHVWNDVWMKRPDLPPEGYDGWQAIDATPQETSDGVYCMGPCSLNSLKAGNVYLPYDGKFAFAEINADRVHWLVKDNGDKEVIYKNQYSVGKKISTNCPEKLLQQNGGDKRLDVTSDYKFADWSQDNRAAVKRAHAFGAASHMDVYEFAGEKDIKCTLTMSDDSFVGEPAEFKVTLKNEGKELRTVRGNIQIRKQHYTGVSHRSFMGKKIDVQVGPGKSVDAVMTVSAEDLLKNVVDHFMYKISFCGHVEETGRSLSDTDDFRLRKPHLLVECAETCAKGEKMKVKVSFENKMAESLTGCKLDVEFTGGVEMQQIPSKVDSKKTFVGYFHITPKKLGKREFAVVFNSNQIKSVNGSGAILVK